jgi:hypothetical protein
MATDAERDAEITALEALIAALEPLDDAARARVLEYTLRRLGMHEVPVPLAGTESAVQTPQVLPPTKHDDVGVTDIRTLREQKAPSSANEMAALAAYYLAELAPAAERKGTVASADIERLFKQANYRLPSRIAMALPNASAAGYFDKAGAGEWKLNPVGHNLVTQTLPRAGGKTASRAKPRPRKKPSAPRSNARTTTKTKPAPARKKQTR